MPKVTAPDYLFCPISLQLMKNPVVTADGQTYEHDEIKKWLETNNTSPLTNKLLANKNLIAAPLIKQVIEDFNKSVCSRRKFKELIQKKNVKELMECRYLASYLTNNEVMEEMIKTEDVEIVSWLLDEGASVDAIAGDKVSLLHRASALGLVPLVKLLLSRGANVNKTDDRGMTPIFHAKTLDVMRLLLDAGAKTDIIADVEYPWLFYLPKDVKQLEYAHREMGMDINTVTTSGVSLLHDAAVSFHVDSMKYLLECGLSVHATTKQQYTPLHFAVPEGDDAVDTPTALRLLLDNGAFVDAKTVDGKTALHMATEAEMPECIKLLLEFGADMFAENNDKVTPFSLAQDNEDIKSIFIQHHRKLLAEIKQQKEKAKQVPLAERQQLTEVQEALEFVKRTLLQVKEGVDEIKQPANKKKGKK